MSDGFDVTCIGLIAANFLIRPVNELECEGDVALVDPIEFAAGGDALNQSISLCRLGKKARLAGKVGDDDFGRSVIEVVKSNNVDVRSVVVDRAVRTSTCAVLIHDDGSRRFLSNRESNERFSINDIDLNMVLDAQVISIGSMLALPLLDGSPTAELLREAKRRGCVTVADTKHNTYGMKFEGVRQALKYVDYFLPSYDEARDLTGESDAGRAADLLLGAGAKNVVVKLGRAGCYLGTPKFCKRIEGYEVMAVDTTGAGDSFVAGFVTGLLDGLDIEMSCNYANAVGAISVTAVGATAGLSGLDPVDRLIGRRVRPRLDGSFRS